MASKLFGLNLLLHDVHVNEKCDFLKKVAISKVVNS